MITKTEALVEIAQIQSEAGRLFVNAEAVKLTGNYSIAHEAFQAYLKQSRLHLEAALDFNAEFPESPFAIPPIVQPLVNALMEDADMLYALGDPAAAEALRKEAGGVARTYLGPNGTAEFERSCASSYTLEGRFNEAIAALMNARDVILGTGDLINLARVAIDLADIFQWLGDYRRAKEEDVLAAALGFTSTTIVAADCGRTNRSSLVYA